MINRNTMNMKTNKKLRLFGLLMALMAVGSLKAQDILEYGFAGDSPVTVLASEEAPHYAYIQLGSAEEERRTNENVQYHWVIRALQSNTFATFVSGIDGDPDPGQEDKPRPWVRLFSTNDHRQGTFSFSCIRVSRIGNQEAETVTVYLSDCPEIVSITPKEGFGCWAAGDEITMDQFEVVTNPSSYNYRVQLADDSRIANAFIGWNNKQDLHFLLDGEPVDYVLPIDVVENGFQWDIIGFQLDKKWIIAHTTIQESVKWSERIKKVTNKIRKAPLMGNADFEFNPYANFNIGLKKSCCNGETHIVGNLNCHAGVEAAASIHKRIGTTPFFLDFKIKGTFDMTLSDWEITSVEGCSAYTFVPIALDFGMQVGVSFDPLESPETISVSGKGVGGINMQFFYYTTSNSWSLFNPDGYFRVEVEGVFLGFRSHWSYTIVD